MAVPKAIVMNLIDIQDDPNKPGVNVLYTFDVRFLFMGPVPLGQQIDVIVPDISTKAQTKTLVDAEIISAAAALGFVLDAAHILTLSDIAG